MGIMEIQPLRCAAILVFCAAQAVSIPAAGFCLAPPAVRESGEASLTEPRMLLAERFAALPHVLMAKSNKLGFFCSNHYDWFRQGPDERPAGLFIGVGSTSNWDLAMRRNARALVLIDHSRDALMAQEYFFKPLLLIARTPAEFLSLLCAIPLPVKLLHARLDKVFAYLDDQLRSDRLAGNEWPSEHRTAYIAAIIKRIHKHPLLDEYHADAVYAHLTWIASNPSNNFYCVPPSVTPFCQLANPLPFESFRERYDPAMLENKGADRSIVEGGAFSFLSSQESFERARMLFAESRVYYVSADAFDPRAYRIIGMLARRLGLPVSGLSLKNVPNIITHDKNRIGSFIMLAARLARDNAPCDDTFTIYHTLGIEEFHVDEQFPAHTQQELLNALNTHGYNRAALSENSDFEYIMDMLLTKPMPIAQPNPDTTETSRQPSNHTAGPETQYAEIGFSSRASQRGQGSKAHFTCPQEKELIDILILYIINNMDEPPSEFAAEQAHFDELRARCFWLCAQLDIQDPLRNRVVLALMAYHGQQPFQLRLLDTPEKSP